MFDDIDKIEGPAPDQQKSNRNSWKYMNWIQKTGVISSIVLYFIFLPLSDHNAKPAMIVGVCGWSCLLFGYVAGSLWKVRHALHFWYSMAFACIVHTCLLPIYWRITQGASAANSAGKLYMYLAVLLVCAETIFLVVVLKRVAMKLHGKHVKAQKGPFAGFNYGE